MSRNNKFVCYIARMDDALSKEQAVTYIEECKKVIKTLTSEMKKTEKYIKEDEDYEIETCDSKECKYEEDGSEDEEYDYGSEDEEECDYDSEDEECGSEEEEECDSESRDEDMEAEDEWQWECCGSQHSLDDRCDMCSRWFCDCDENVRSAIHKSAQSCRYCGKHAPN